MKSKFPFFSRSTFWFLTMVFPVGSHAAELQASDGIQYDSFGSSVSISGDFALIGAENSGTESGGQQGSAYLFLNLDTASGTITQNATLVASDRMSGDYFGRVSISQNIAIVGSFASTIGNNYGQGAAYLFRDLYTANGTISQNAKLIASDGGRISSFGGAVSASLTNGLIGAARNQVGINSDQGSAYLFRNLNTVTGTVTEDIRLTASDGRAGDFLGSAVSLSSEGALVGAPGVRFGNVSMNQGAAYYFRNLAISGPTATESSKLIASDGAPNDYFGSAVSLSASTTTALIGAPFAQVNSSYNQGAAYLFRDLVSSTGTITQQVKLVASNSSSGGIGALFGSSVSLSPSEKQALVGAPSDSSQGDDPISFQDRGAVYYFSNLDTAAGVVNESLKITASDGKPFDNFGSSVDFGGDRFVIGAWHGDGASASTGKAYSGSINSMTTIDRGNSRTTNGLSFTSQMDWIVGKSSFLNEVTLSAGDYANITATGKAVYIGVNDESHFNHLTIAGTLVTNGVQIGSQGINFGNNLTIAENGIVETGFIRGALGGENRLKIDGGTIRFTESGTAIANFQAGDIRILNQGATFDTQDNSIAIGTAMAGKGGLTKLGSGTLELSGANTYSGQTLIHEGTLQLGDPSAPSSIAGDVLISKFAGLGGNGIIHGQLVNSGELAPGNSPGIIQVGGAFVQTGTGTLQMEITKDDHDRLITGSGTVLGGTLVLVADGSTFAFGQHFNLIQSDSPITGGFDSIKTSGFNDVREEFKIIGNAGILSIAPESYTQVANTPNEANLATALDNWIDDSDGDTEMVSDSLDQLTAAEYHQAFAAISPALYGAALDTAIEQSQSQSTTLAQHLASRRLREVPATMESKDWEAWAVSTGLYSAGSMSSLAGNEFSSGNFLSGIERKLDATFTAGLFTGFADSVGTFSGASRTEQDRLTFGGYATAQRDGYYATTALGAGILDLDVTRSIRFGNLSRTAKSSTDGSEFFGLVSGGYDLHANNWTFGPTASFQYSKVRYDDVKENGAGALDLAIENPEDDSLRSQIGARVAYLHKASEQLTLIPEARLFWQHEFLRDNSPLDSTLEQGAGPGFSHSIAKSDGDSVSGGVALGFQTPVGFYGNISYDVELGRESNLNQTLSIGADWKF